MDFTVETDGRLPTGDSLADAIETVDAATDRAPAYFVINCAHPNDAAGGAQRTRAHCFAVVGQSTVGSRRLLSGLKACGAGSPAGPSERKTRGSTAKSPLLALWRSDDHRFPIRLLLLAEEEVELVDALDDTILGRLAPGPMLTNCSLQSRTWSIESAFLHPRRTKPVVGFFAARTSQCHAGASLFVYYIQRSKRCREAVRQHMVCCTKDDAFVALEPAGAAPPRHSRSRSRSASTDRSPALATRTSPLRSGRPMSMIAASTSPVMTWSLLIASAAEPAVFDSEPKFFELLVYRRHLDQRLVLDQQDAAGARRRIEDDS